MLLVVCSLMQSICVNERITDGVDRFGCADIGRWRRRLSPDSLGECVQGNLLYFPRFHGDQRKKILFWGEKISLAGSFDIRLSHVLHGMRAGNLEKLSIRMIIECFQTESLPVIYTTFDADGHWRGEGGAARRAVSQVSNR